MSIGAGEKMLPYDLERQLIGFEQDPLTPETLDRLDSYVEGFTGEAVEIEWSDPELSLLRNLRIVIGRGGIFCAEVSEPFSTVPGRRADAVPQISAAVENGLFVRGGERLAQTVFAQMDIDRARR
jgi:hypothetical protein